MSNVSQLFSKQNNQTLIQEEACLWISRIDRGLDSQERLALVTWCNQNSAHQESLLKMASHWDDLSVLNELSGLFPLEEKPVKSHFLTIATAASIALLSVLGVNSFVSQSFLPFIPSIHEQKLVQEEVFSTNVGEQASFTLSDGTHIQLNTDSLVKVNYSLGQRGLTLLNGEARFDVAKDKNRPFTVTVDDNSFTALGTIFNVQKNSDNVMELVVTEGKVLITKANESKELIKQTLQSVNALAIDTLAKNVPAETITLPKELAATLVLSGEKAVVTQDTLISANSYNNVSVPVNKVSLDEIHRDLAWQHGMLIFNGEPLSDALQEISRYTNSNFEIVDTELAKIKVAGYFKADDIDGLLNSLNSNFGIQFTKIEHNKILLTASN